MRWKVAVNLTRALSTSVVALFLASAPVSIGYSQSQQVVDNVFFQTDLRQAIEDVAAQLGINIIADPSVQGIVSVTLEDAPVEQALELLLAGTGFRYLRRPDYILVFNPDASADFFTDISVTRRVELQNLTPGAARGLLPEPLQRFVRVDEGSGRLAVTAPEGILNRILMDLTVLDQEEESITTFVALEFVQAEAARLLLPQQMQRFVRVDPTRNSVVVTAPLEQRTEITSLLRRLDRPTGPTSTETPNVYPTHRIDLSHGQAGGILALLSDAHQAFVRADESSNMLAVSAPRHIVDGIIRDIRSLDRPRQHVMLEARVVVLERTDLLDFGTDFRWPTIQAGAFATDESGGMPWELRIGYSPSRQFTNALSMSLNFLSANNEATIVSSPQVLAQDGLPAEIRVTTEEFFEISSETTGVVRAQLEQIETGTILNITPRVASSGHMTLNMELEVSDVIGRGENNLPVVSRRTASSTVRIENGGTAAVAGLADNRSQIRNSGTPVFRRLPLLGTAFGRDGLNHQARQVAIFVTATLVDEDGRARRTGETPQNQIRSVSDDQYRAELEAALHRMGRSVD
ncbi:MAG: type II secretion system protein GspD [Planctomycetaceae bacterium]|nr:MAG: type II secretion system protein GspD [Planctomycetaceae bacterium]